MEKREVVAVSDGTLEASVNLNNAFNAWCYFYEKYLHLDEFQKDVNDDVYAVWEQIEVIFRLVELAKLELDIARGEESPLVKDYLEKARERIAYFDEEKRRRVCGALPRI